MSGDKITKEYCYERSGEILKDLGSLNTKYAELNQSLNGKLGVIPRLIQLSDDTSSIKDEIKKNGKLSGTNKATIIGAILIFLSTIIVTLYRV